MTKTEDQAYIEDQYFLHICTALLAVGADESGIEERAHRIMDLWTIDGVLDTESLDAIIDQWDFGVNDPDRVSDTPLAEQYGG